MLRIEKDGVVIPIPPDIASDGNATEVYVQAYPASVLAGGQGAVDAHFEKKMKAIHDLALETTHANEVKRREAANVVGVIRANAPATPVLDVDSVEIDENGG